MTGNPHAEHLTAVKREQRWKNVRPRDAATILLIDQRSDKPHVLMGKRHMRHTFMPGKFVFPGGRVDRGDGAVPAAAELDEDTHEKLYARMKGTPSHRRARAFALAAIRETFEETGIALGLPANGHTCSASDWQEFFGLGLAPDLSELRFVARAITPPRRPRRFDTRFFAIDMSRSKHAGETVMKPSDELEELAWIPLSDAKSLDIPAITGVILDELQARIAEDAAMSPRLPVPFYHLQRGQFIRETI